MNRAIRIVLLTLLFFPLWACQSGGMSSGTKGLKFAYIAKQRDQSFHEGIVNGIQKEMAKKHVSVEIFSAQNQHDVETQRQLIREFAKSKKYDGVMICPNDSQALIQDVAELDKAGIPFLFIDTALVESDVTRSFTNNCGFVGTDNVAVGKRALEYIMGRIKSGKILMIRGIPEHRSSSDREIGFVDEVKKYPEFETIGFLQGDWKTDTAYKSFTELMQKNTTNIDAVFAYNDHMALGVSQYYDEHPSLKRPIIVGVDGTVVGQKGLLENKIDAIVVQATELMGIDGLNRIMSCLDDRTSRDVMTPVTLLTASSSLQQR